jgi:hypothetical protein
MQRLSGDFMLRLRGDFMLRLRGDATYGRDHSVPL